MLAALKPQLLAETALEVVALQEKEFRFYEGHISMLQTFSTLLAGFAFTTFVSVSEPLTVNMLLFKAPTLYCIARRRGNHGPDRNHDPDHSGAFQCR